VAEFENTQSTRPLNHVSSRETLKSNGEKLVTVVFGDQLKRIINQIHEQSPFSTNAFEETLEPKSQPGNSENITETIDLEGTKNRLT
jgi:hypothetical protein